jgi:hypothetical protein
MKNYPFSKIKKNAKSSLVILADWPKEKINFKVSVVFLNMKTLSVNRKIIVKQILRF